MRSTHLAKRTVIAALIAGAAALTAPHGAGAYATGESASEVRGYWTQERMEAAIPADALLEDVADSSPVPDLGLGLGSTAARRAQARKVDNPKSKPYRTHGKVFFTLGLSDYVCSGTSVKSKTKSLVVTAGHCTHSQADGYASNFMFAPAFKDGARPFGEWTAKRLKATPQWENREDESFDVGMATMRKRNGKKLAQVVGKRGIAFNRGRNLNFHVFGYPAEDPYDGQSMYRCDAPAQGTDNGMSNPKPTRIDCDMTGGSSGGGWVTGSGDVNSVVSYGYECVVIILPCRNPEDGKLFGPYFGAEIKKLYRSQKK